jgi:hypothetical protein
MARAWEPDTSAGFERRLGKSPVALGVSESAELECPDVWLLTNGDVAVIGRDLTAEYTTRLPKGVSVGPGERLVVLPGAVLSAAKRDIPNP